MIGIPEPRVQLRRGQRFVLDVVGPGDRWAGLVYWGPDDVTVCRYGDRRRLATRRTGLSWDKAVAVALEWIVGGTPDPRRPRGSEPPWKREGMTWQEYGQLPRAERLATGGRR